MSQKKTPHTSTLLRRLFKASSLDRFLEENSSGIRVPAFHEVISAMCRERNETAEAVIGRSGIERTYGHQLFNGTRKPSRDKVIQLAIGFGMNAEETEELLKAAGKSPLYPRVERDCILLFGIHKGYGIMEIQELLHEKGATILGGSPKYEDIT